MDKKQYEEQLKYAMDLFRLQDYEKASEIFKEIISVTLIPVA